MISGENLFNNILSAVILFLLFILVYAKLSGKTLPDMIRDVRDGFSGGAEEVYEAIPQTFENIR